MAYVVEENEQDEFFEFQLPGNEDIYRLVSVATLSAGVVELLADPNNSVAGIIAAAADDESRDAIRTLKAKPLGKLRDAWIAHSGITPGESSAS